MGSEMQSNKEDFSKFCVLHWSTLFQSCFEVAWHCLLVHARGATQFLFSRFVLTDELTKL
jgi:hypothetical protein